MNGFIVFSRSQDDIWMLREVFRRIVGFSVNDEWTVRKAGTLPELSGVLREGEDEVLCCLDATLNDGIPAAEQIRRSNRRAQMILVVDKNQSPVTYIRPTIMPSGVLMHPLRRDEADALLRELVASVRQQKRKDDFGGEVFTVSSKGTAYRIQLSDILYFEARNKKLFLNTAHMELEFYDSLDRLVERLPSQFVRCHKSFVVNRACVNQFVLAQNLLLLEDGSIQIPVSRSYKAALKEAMQ